MIAEESEMMESPPDSPLTIKRSSRRRSEQVPKAPDGGWVAWLVVFGSFALHFMADGVVYCFGLFYAAISDDLRETKANTAWVASIMIGILYCSGPLSAALVNRFGCRPISIAGSLMATFGFGISYWATSLTFLYISIGVLGGIGLGLMYLPAIVSVTTYFEKKRAFATGIAVSGSGIGTFAMSPLLGLLIREYDWEGALVWVAGFLFLCSFFSLTFRPLEEPPPSDDPEVGHERVIPLIKSPRQSTEDVTMEPLMARSLEINNLIDKRLSHLRPQPGNTLTGSSSQPVFPVGMAESTDSLSTGNESKKISYGNSEISIPALIQPSPRGLPRNTSSGLLIRRKDIFYSGSLIKIQELTEEKFHGTLLRTPESSIDSIGPKKICGVRCGNEFYEVFHTMMDFTILRDKVFVFFAISNFLTCIGYNVPYIFLPDMAVHNTGTNSDSAGFLLAIVGISNTVSRVVLGYLSDKAWINRLFLYNTSLAICGLATALSPLTSDINLLRTYAAVFGVTVGVFISLTSVILVDLFGLKRLTNAFGLLLLFQGIATIVGAPIVGGLYDVTQEYKTGFWMAGACLGTSGLMLFAIPLFKKKEKPSIIPEVVNVNEFDENPENVVTKVLPNGNGISSQNGKISNGFSRSKPNSREV